MSLMIVLCYDNQASRERGRETHTQRDTHTERHRERERDTERHRERERGEIQCHNESVTILQGP